MTIKVPRRPHRLGWAGTQLTDARRSRRHLPGPRPGTGGVLTTRWTQAADGRLSLEWTLVRPTPQLIDRTRGSDA